MVDRGRFPSAFRLPFVYVYVPVLHPGPGAPQHPNSLLSPLPHTTLMWWCQFLVDKDTADLVSACAWICQMEHTQLFLMELSLQIKYSDDGNLVEVPCLLGAQTWPTAISLAIWVVRS